MRYLAAVCLVLASCGGGADDKDLFSLWKAEATGAPMDLTGAKFGSDNNINLYTTDGTRCICDLAIVGDQKSGTIALTGCISIPYNAVKDKQCVAFDGAGSYSKTSTVLTLVKGGSTTTFK